MRNLTNKQKQYFEDLSEANYAITGVTLLISEWYERLLDISDLQELGYEFMRTQEHLDVLLTLLKEKQRKAEELSDLIENDLRGDE